jgi:hypothetical protein
MVVLGPERRDNEVQANSEGHMAYYRRKPDSDISKYRSPRWRAMMASNSYSTKAADLNPGEMMKFLELHFLQMWDLKRLADDFRLTDKAAAEAAELADKPGKHLISVLLETAGPEALNRKRGSGPARDATSKALTLIEATDFDDGMIAAKTGLSVQHVASLRS